MQVVYHNQLQWYELLYDEPTDTYSLEVACGTVGIYTVRVALSPEQVEHYRQDGAAALDGLAEHVRQAEERRLLSRRAARLNEPG